MASIASLPVVLYDAICAFLSADDMIQAASTARSLREHFFRCLSQHEPQERAPGVILCERIGPYIGTVNIFVHAEVEDGLAGLMQSVCSRRHLKRLAIGDSIFTVMDDRYAEERPSLCQNYRWLSIVANCLEAADLPHLQDVQLATLPGPKRVDREVVDEDGGVHQEWIKVSPLAPLDLLDFIAALPPSMTKLKLGNIDDNSSYGGPSPEALVCLMTALQAGSFPQLRELQAPSHLKPEAFAHLVSALQEGAFASTIEVLVLAPSRGCSSPSRRGSIGPFAYRGPLDVGPLINALRCCPSLRSITLGRGKCEARLFFDFMDLVLSGELQHFDHVPLPTDLPVSFATSEEMDRAVGLIAQALVLGRFKDTQSLVLGDDPTHQPVSDAALRSFLTDTMDCPLPRLAQVAIKGHFEPPTLHLLREWLERRGDLTGLIIKCTGRPLLTGGEGEKTLLDIFRRSYNVAGLRSLELCWRADWVGMAGGSGPSQLSASHMSRVGQVPHPRASVLNTLQDILKSSRRYEVPLILDEGFSWPRTPACCGAFFVTTEPAETEGGGVKSAEGGYTEAPVQVVLGSADHSFDDLMRFGRSDSELALDYFRSRLSDARDLLVGATSGEVRILGNKLTLQSDGTIETTASQLSVDFEKADWHV